MDIRAIVSSIDEEITRLQRVRSILTTVSTVDVQIGPGRPKKTGSVPKPKRTMSAEGRARIAAAQKKRWAAKKKES